jgi:hypothetical protein
VKITRVETIVLNLPMVIDGATPMLGGRARTSIDMLLVRIETDAGITGWGEAFGHRIFPATRAAIDTLLGPMCVGRDATAIAVLTDDLQRTLHGSDGAGPRCTRCRASTSRCGTSPARRPGCRCTGSWAVARAPTCRPTRACCATGGPRPSPTTPPRRWPVAIAM